MPEPSKPNATISQSDYINYYTESSMSAKEIAEEIFEKYCVMGVAVVSRDLIEHFRGYDFSYMN